MREVRRKNSIASGISFPVAPRPGTIRRRSGCHPPELIVIRRILDFPLALLTPTVLPFVLLALGWLAGRRKWLRTRVALLWSAAIIAYVLALVPVGDQLILPLETAYPPLQTDALPRVDYVVVLGSGFAPHDAVPVSAALDREGLVRIVEGVSLAKRLGSVKLVVSGGAQPGHSPPAEGYAMLARELGIPDASLIVLHEALNTAQEARDISRRLGAAPFLLVTSAVHMPRAMRQMQRVGAHAIAAPTGQLAGRPLGLDSVLPSSAGLDRTEHALHEYLGLVATLAHVSD